ncbi:hypothetical protein KBY74_10850, partial [Cyanobium sp. A1C-AMD]|nr:hypothetical protein [Cyanobium sp. A1C-AMD]
MIQLRRQLLSLPNFVSLSLDQTLGFLAFLLRCEGELLGQLFSLKPLRLKHWKALGFLAILLRCEGELLGQLFSLKPLSLRFGETIYFLTLLL